MKNFLSLAIVTFIFSTGLQAQQAPNAKEYIHLEACFATTENLALDVCAERQIDTCWNATGAASVSSSQCMYEAFRQADDLLNAYYQRLMPAARRAANQLEGSAYALDGNPLLESQRAWLPVRDTTCNLRVLYAATGPGRGGVVDGCKARLTMQRIGDLNNELGFTLDPSY